jgi:hypothetical protein
LMTCMAGKDADSFDAKNTKVHQGNPSSPGFPSCNFVSLLVN